ncbi:MAG: hypothetical protein JKY87_02420 [Mariprofundus sp.]|nr:hypothetical protein [Mariprofundus sp.]
MIRSVFFTSLLFISFSANAAPVFDPAKNADMQMKGLDANNNRVAELREYLHVSERVFVRMDVNSDYAISPKELANFRFRRAAKLSDQQKIRLANNIINLMDKDNNHSLSKEEYLQPARDEFHNTDGNHDMKVTRAEMTANWKRKMAELKAKLEEE